MYYTRQRRAHRCIGPSDQSNKDLLYIQVVSATKLCCYGVFYKYVVSILIIGINTVVYRDRYFRIRSLALEQPLTSVPTVVTHLVLLSTLHATHSPRLVAASSP